MVILTCLTILIHHTVDTLLAQSRIVMDML